MMRWLPRLQSKAVRDEEAVARSTSAQYLFRGTSYIEKWNVERAVKEGFERSLWVFKAVDAIASNQARLPIVIRRGDEAEGELVLDDRLLYLLNRKANVYEKAAQFRYRLSAQLLLSKKGAFVEVVRDRVGRPTALYLLPPDKVEPVPDPDTFVSHYKLTHASGQIDEIEPERVVWMKKPHPIDPYTGITPLEAAGLTVDTDFYARLFNRNFMQNDGRPGGLIGVKGQLRDDDASELKRRFAGGPQNAGRTTVIEADDISWVDTATTPRDAQYVQSMGITKTDILLAFGVPESVIGNASGRTYDNADAEREIFWQVTMLPHLDLVSSGLDELTAGGIEDDDYVGFDVSSIDVLQRQEKERHKKLKEEYDAGLISIAEYREGTGRDPDDFDTPGTRVLWIPGGKVPVAANPEDQAAAQQIMPVGTPDMGMGGIGAMPGGGGGGQPAVGAAPERPALAAGGGSSEYADMTDDEIMADLGFKSAEPATPLLMPEDLTDEEFARVVIHGTATPEDIARERAHADQG